MSACRKVTGGDLRIPSSLSMMAEALQDHLMELYAKWRHPREQGMKTVAESAPAHLQMGL